ncbi:hypothetical protein CBM2586_A110084 [Cupriavidus phytorum]|uniref:Uncharacterized protein n=1 Tax=Cupriavidus taiwanensis TaxID=164546 RepID=A0A375C0P7_9BURK|nr:hypothetical protein CBM2586_A110084 [Cupriavidus taiwanensis]
MAAAQLGYCLIVPVANAWIMNVAAEYRAFAAGMLGGLQTLDRRGCRVPGGSCLQRFSTAGRRCLY